MANRRYLKIIFISILIFLFFELFGFPSIKRFREGATIIETSVETSNSISPPAMLVCSKDAWKIKKQTSISLLRDACKDRDDLYECINKTTFQRQEIVRRLAKGRKRFKNYLSKESLWEEDITFGPKGRCHRMIYNDKIGSDFD